MNTLSLYIGLISGTSMDAIDAVLLDFSSSPPRLIATHSEAMPVSLKINLLQLCEPGSDEINRLGQLDVQVGLLFAQACQQLLQKSGYKAEDILAIGSHGQTIRHHPTAHFPFTLQIGDPNIIAEKTRITTVADFRRRDMAAGGQGAPLVPAFHHSLFHDATKNRVILNIGGMANVTVLPADSDKPIIGFDTGPGNVLLDSWIKEQLNLDCDKEGAWANSSEAQPELLHCLLADPYFTLAPPKSTGREYFNLSWLNAKLAQKNIPAAAVQATLTQFTAHSIRDAITHYCPNTQEVLVCGGGVHNSYLMKNLQDFSPYPVNSTAIVGIDPDWIEAMAFAWLAKQTLEKRTGNMPAVTGATAAVILGGIYYSH